MHKIIKDFLKIMEFQFTSNNKVNKLLLSQHQKYHAVPIHFFRILQDKINGNFTIHFTVYIDTNCQQLESFIALFFPYYQ